jgi:hypothetical protein
MQPIDVYIICKDIEAKIDQLWAALVFYNKQLFQEYIEWNGV